MKAFSYSLEKILKLRKHYEDEAKIELGKAVSALAEIEQKIYANAAETVRAQEAQFASNNTATQMQQYMFYLIRLHNAKEELLSEAAKAEQIVEQAREAFLEASRERKVLDKLKEKRLKEHRKMVLIEETNAMDDIYANLARAGD